MRARLDVSEIEAQTKIRAKYLRALENEEWSLLPGPTFIKSFLRTYAQALGLDGRALVEEYRLHHERPNDAAFDPIASTPPMNFTGMIRNGASGICPLRMASTCGMPLPAAWGEIRRTSEAAIPAAAAQAATNSQTPSGPCE